MTKLLALHLLGLGPWIGCIATEAVFERTTGREPGLAGAVAVEVWAFVLVLLTGAAHAPTNPAFANVLGKDRGGPRGHRAHRTRGQRNPRGTS